MKLFTCNSQSLTTEQIGSVGEELEQIRAWHNFASTPLMSRIAIEDLLCRLLNFVQQYPDY